jgi:hypothetical protein
MAGGRNARRGSGRIEPKRTVQKFLHGAADELTRATVNPALPMRSEIASEL